MNMREKFGKIFGLINLDQYHNFYVPNDTLLLTDTFQNFCNKCMKAYQVTKSQTNKFFKLSQKHF